MPALSKAALAIVATLSVGAVQAGPLQELKSQEVKGVNADFAKWRKAQREARLQEQTDQFIVEYVSNKQDVRSINSSFEKTAFKNEKIQHVRKLKGNKHVYKLSKNLKNADKKAFLNALKNNKNVRSVEMDPKRYLMSETVPWGIPNIQADQVSDSAASNMKVCIIDSGYERSNPDLNANNASGTNDSGTGNWYQAGGSHGTHVAGTIAGVNNSEGVVGVLPNTNVNLHIIKVFNAEGWAYSSDLVTAVNNCVSAGSKVINMSLGGPSQNATERAGLEAATAQGVLLIAASGNDGDSSLSYPASYDTVMAVGAVDETGKHAEFSQYTPQVEIAGPGEAILSTVAGDGRLGSITVGGTTYANDRVAPQTHFVNNGTDYVVQNVNGSVSGYLGSCSVSGSSYSCSNVSGNICVAERNDNQKGSNYPEINPAKACMDAGATGVIVYSNSDRPGLQNPFLVDANNDVNVPAVSVNRALGQTLMGKLGQYTTLNVTANQDYAYYNGTSMATPHVAAAAALAWSNNIDCTASEVRNALKQTAVDLETSGRDDKTGYGLVQVKAASDYMAANCGGTPPSGELVNGQSQSISGSAGQELEFTMTVPSGATNLKFEMAGGSGDADLYVRFGAKPTDSTWDCRPYKNGNNESCPISSAQAGTYHVRIVGYTTFSGATITGSYTSGTTPSGYSTTVNDIDVSAGAWKRYTIDVPAGMSTFTVKTYNGTGDADLYLRLGAQPTTSSWDCRPYENGNNEICTINNPTAGTWHIGINAYSTVNNVDMDVSYQP